MFLMKLSAGWLKDSSIDKSTGSTYQGIWKMNVQCGSMEFNQADRIFKDIGIYKEQRYQHLASLLKLLKSKSNDEKLTVDLNASDERLAIKVFKEGEYQPVLSYTCRN